MAGAKKSHWLEHLAESGIKAADAKKLHIKWLSPTSARTTLRMEHVLPCGGLHFPYFTFSGKIDPDVCRVRLLPDPRNGFTETNLPKYLQPPGSPPRIYLPPLLDWKAYAKDATQPLVITEGEKKAAAACQAGVACLGLGGVWSFQQKSMGVQLLPQLMEFNWVGRQVVIAYDSDWGSNSDIGRAVGMLARRLNKRGAEVRAAMLSNGPGGKKIGLDDLIVARGVKALKVVLAAASPLTPELEATADYRARFILVRTLACAWDRETGTLYSRTRLLDAFPDESIQTLSATGNATTTTKAAFWWQDPTKRAASRMVLEPGEPEITSKGDLNQFRGWGAEAKRGSTEIWQKLLHSLFQGRTELIIWFEKWCAYPIQNPGAKLHTAVFVYGGQGIGKSAVGLVLLDIYGKSGRLIQDREVFGGYNGWLGQTLFVLADDLSFDDRKKSRSVIKVLIDSESMEVNEKYVPSYPVRNRCNFYFTANSPGALPLDPSGINRRFLVIEAPRERPFPSTWYTKTFHNWRAKGGGSAVHDRLRRLNLSGFHSYADAPASDAKDLVVSTGRSNVESWVSEIANHTTMELGTVRQFYELYRQKTNDLRTGLGAFTTSFRNVAEPLGCQRVGDQQLSLWAIKNIKKWQKAKAKARATQYFLERGTPE